MWVRRMTCAFTAMAVLSAMSCTGIAQAREYTPVTESVHPSGVDVEVQPAPVRSSVDDDSSSLGEGLASQARSAVVMDNATGKVLFEKDGHEKLPLASITKIMTMLLIMESLDKGQISLKDSVKVSENASSMGGSQVFLQPGESMSVDDMLKAIAMASANDACVAMAEHIYGSQEAFVKQMNRRAKQLDMVDTHFVNCNGLPAADHYSSAHDIALMSRELLKHEQITKYTSVYSDYLRKDTEHPFWLVNTNKLVRFYDGVDGLKTGFTQEAKYCLSATAKKDGFRVITVVMGEPKPSVRNKEVSEMLNWSFSQFTSTVLYPAGKLVGEKPVAHGVPERVRVITGDTVGVLQHKGDHVDYHTDVKLNPLKAPLRKGEQVGVMKVYEGDKVVAKVPLVAATDVEKAGLFQSLGMTFRKVITFGIHT